MQPIVSMKGITKQFPGVLANNNIDFEVNPGEIHALVGENGAGKSTLMSILYGLYQPDRGEIFLRGKRVAIKEPATAIKLGLGMVFQHFMLVPPLTVAENVVLGTEPRRGWFFDLPRAVRQVEEISKTYGLKVDPLARVENISVGIQQRVEIIKTLYRGAEILILDEPTAVLTPQEVEELFKILRLLKEQGKTIIFITHKLKEIMTITDRITVLRNGESAGTVMTRETSQQELARMMVGRDVLLRVKKKTAQPGEVTLRVDNLTASNNRNLPALNGVSFQIRTGEIFGIAGVEGNGQSELVEVLTGLRPSTGGSVELRGQSITNLSPRSIRETGIAHIPEDRHKRGLVLNFDLAENLVFGVHYRKPFTRSWGILNWPQIKDTAAKLLKQYDVRTPGHHLLARSLSGGNQQKLIVARELEQQPSLLIASQPTRGVDIGAIEFIHNRLLEERGNGKAVLLVSAELQEIMTLADTIGVMYEGKLMAVLPASEASEEKLGLLMAGVTADPEGGQNE